MVWLSVTAAPIFKASASALDWDAVGEKYVVFAFGQSLCQCAAHVAAADETDGVELLTPFLQCDEIFQKDSRWCSTIVEEKGGKVNIQTIKQTKYFAE